MERILVVDDDLDILRLVSFNLQQAGFEAATAPTGSRALDMVQASPPDLVILDLMLPDVDGLEVCRRLRQDEVSRRIPIVMLTARGEELDRVVGFEVGADDYVTKPFSPRELILRVRSILRRGKDERQEVLKAGPVHVFPSRRQCFVDDQQILLTAKEFDLLSELIRAGGNVLARDTLMERVWGYHGDAASRTLDTHIRRLREKLGPMAARIETVRGIGFRIQESA